MGVQKLYGTQLLAGGKIVRVAAGTPSSSGATFGKPENFTIDLKRVLHFKYDFSIDGGAISTITLATPGIVIPATAIVLDFTANAIVAPVGAGASIAFGVLAGGSTTTLKASTAITSYTLDAILKGAMSPAAPVKMTAAGLPTMTISGAALTAGLIECWVEYYSSIAE